MKITRFRRPALAALTAAALGLAGMAAPGSALASTTGATVSRPSLPAPKTARPETQHATAKAAAPGVRRVCEAPKPGFASCLSLVRTNVPGHQGAFAAGTAPSGYGPSDLQSAYDLPSATAGAGETVAVVDAYDDPAAETDLQTYRAQYGLPACDTANGCFRKVNQDGQEGSYPLPSPGWTEEESLDIDMVSAVCPRCRILLVEANNASLGNLGEAVNQAVQLGAKYVSNSYGAVESSSEVSDDAYYDHPGVAITAAAGDSSYDNGDGVAPSYPAASPYVTAVGGTSLTRDPSTSRGWAETTWDGTTSGCSLYEPKPAWQADSACGNRMVADVSAVADPDTGVAIYDSYQAAGWQVIGGTSVASPIIASVYALAGPPATGSYPASYPYADPSGLNDITTGDNGTCTPAYWCTAGPGYDGPTGLGTPDGAAAFWAGPRGTITGTITSAETRQPVAGAQVQAGDLSADTGSAGQYTISVPPGTYPVTVSDLGYKTKAVTGVHVTAGQAVTENLALKTVPTVTITGTVTDGSGHGWPLYARISVPGTTAAAYTDPATGQYTLALPENSAHTIDVDPLYPGYQQASQKVKTGTASLTDNFAIPVDSSTCTAPGYTYTYTGTTQRFTAATLPRGWTVTTKGPNPGWTIVTPTSSNLNDTGGKGNFANANYPQESSLLTPVTNMTGDAAPIASFDSYYPGNYTDFPSRTGGVYVQVSTDRGAKWHTVWLQTTSAPPDGQFVVPLPQAAGQPAVQVRFLKTGVNNYNWELDNVFLGNRPCTPSISGGLLVGTVTDANTGQGVSGADVTAAGSAQVTATTAPATGDPALGNGFYWMFSPLTGSQQLQATGYNYATQAATADVTANAVTRQDFTLPAGQLTATPGSLSTTQQLGTSTAGTLTLTNTGSSPASLNLTEQPGGFTPAGQTSAARTAAVPAGWATLPSLPHRVLGNLVASDPATGDMYSVGGDVGYPATRQTAAGYVYQPGASSWTPIPDMPAPDAYPVGGMVNGKLYVVGGQAQSSGAPVWIYDPVTQQWSAGVQEPNNGVDESGAAVLDGKIYAVGGTNDSGSTNVEVYDPASNTWSPAANYPHQVLYPACGGLDGELYCAGGLFDGDSEGTHEVGKAAYAYNPATNTWSAIAPLPIPLSESSYTSANGQLLIAGGYSENPGLLPGHGRFPTTNAAYSYTPGKGWTALPALPTSARFAGGSCGPGGFYVAGGIGNVNGSYQTLSSAEVLPGYSACGSGTDVPWLSVSPASATTLQPGQSVTATITMNASSASVTQPGTYTAQIIVDSNTPYPLSVPVTMTITPPKTWGKITGTVTDAATGNPIAGATVQICTFYDQGTGSCDADSTTYTLTTSANGSYSLWLDHRYNPLQVLVTAAGHAPQAQTAKITAGKTTTVNLALAK